MSKREARAVYVFFCFCILAPISMPYMLASRSVLPHFSISKKFFFLYLSHQTTYGFKNLQLTEASTKESGIDFFRIFKYCIYNNFEDIYGFYVLGKIERKNRILVTLFERYTKRQT
jgi:hypothetical protein